ncbi:MAG: YihY/virulence factor BrkB family protein [Cyanobacteria bacterium]|nr:YihY/virulence factor BrkB family protein [Cyanobacteriota bacterium]MDW8200900.1 YihY/virulence factor BrkB family protein [Cyanobacteriota bacterium SKYGB_h_bin112]
MWIYNRLNCYRVALLLLKRTIVAWRHDRASLLAAALAFYTTFSLAPLLVIGISIASLIFNQETVQQSVLEQIQLAIGREGAVTVQAMISAQLRERSGLIPTVTSIAVMVFGASIVFTQLQESLNLIWKADANWGIIRGFLLGRMNAFLMAVSTGLLMLCALVLSTGLTVLARTVGSIVPGAIAIVKILDPLVSVGLIAIAFAAIYKVVPHVKIKWGDVWLGAIITAMLFNLGKLLISLYLTRSGLSSAYGAAGSLVAILTWVYYSAQILLFGAEFTKIYAHTHGSHRPSLSTGK